MTSAFYIECLDCGAKTQFVPSEHNCPLCGSMWREARYDYATLGKTLPSLVARRPFNLWRYRELLPVQAYNPELSMGDGGTPLIHAINLGMMLGCPNIYIKDERQGPTNSFKDRQAAVNISVLKEAGVTEMVLASTGNVAIAYSAYAARAGIKLWAFLTSLVPAEKMREVALYGTQVVKVTASYDRAKKIAAEFAHQRGLYLEGGSKSIPAVESMKTISFEAAEQLTEMMGPPETGGYRVPDWYFQAISGGIGPLGVMKGFFELRNMGLSHSVPALAGIQADGCAPMVHAWKKNQETVIPVLSPRTHITTISTGDPGRTYTLLREQMLANRGGAFEDVSDEDAFRAMHILAKMEGISVEPATAVAFAGLIKLARAGQIKPSDVVLMNCSGHTMSVESTILGEGWVRDIVLPDKKTGPLSAEVPQEGLLSALNHVDANRYTRIAIVDDTEDARRLIRRILQSQGDYTLFEATNGREAIELAQREVPDLMILDLMMPELDGFSVLDALKADPRTAPIPVIVVTAKELTDAERKRLSGQVHSLMQKGEFLSDDLMGEVKATVKNGD